jgi:hypothetical protein
MWALVIVASVAAGGCRRATPLPTSAPAPDASVRASTTPVQGSWYAFALPRGGVQATVAMGGSEIEAVYELEPLAHLGVTISRPMPRQADLDHWFTMITSKVFKEPPIDADAGETIDDVPVRVRTTAHSVDWYFAADGFGVFLRCGREPSEPTTPAWLHEHCDPVLKTFRLTRPIHD